MLIVQGIDMIDNQLREALAEHLVVCRRLDRVNIPFIGKLLKQFGLKGTLPKIHSAKVHYGDTPDGMVVDRWIYRGRHLYKAYNTKQIFSPFYSHGVYSYLSPWHTTGRFLPAALSLRQRLTAYFKVSANPPNPLPLKPKSPLVEKIMRLPDPKQREQFIRRFQKCGAI